MKQGSGSAQPAPRRNKAGNRGRQTDPKNHGHPAAHKNNKNKRNAPSAPGKPDASASGSTGVGNKQAPVVVCTKSSHPHCVPGTFDAAALLKSVLSVVEPTLEERLQSLEETL